MRKGAVIGNIHVCWRLPSEKKLLKDSCPDCSKKSWFVALLYNWEGWYETCLRCGRQWFNGEWEPLEFLRAARKDNIANAKAHYRWLENEQKRKK